MRRQSDAPFAESVRAALGRRLRSWTSRLRPWWQDYRWPVIGGLWLLAFLLGCLGIQRYFQMYPPPHPPAQWDIVYNALQLFVLNWSGPGPVPWQLQVARFLAPFMAAYTATEALALLFFDQFQLLRTRRLHDHVIICGLGRKGLLLAKAFRERGMPVIVIEQDDDNDLIQACRWLNIIVSLGNASKPDVLRKARVQFARHLISVCGDDSVNAEVAAHASEIIAEQPERTLTCAIHIVNPDLWYLLRKWEVTTNAAFRLQFFSVFDIGARAILDAYPPFPESGAGVARPQHLLIVGAGKLAERLIVHTARRWQGRVGAGQNMEERVKMTLVDGNAEEVLESLHLHHPELARFCDIHAYSMEVSSPSFQRSAFLTDAAHLCPVTTIYICIDNDALGLSTALTLLNKLGRTDTPVIVSMSQNAGLATLLGRVGGKDGAYQSLHAFGLLDQACQPDLVLGGTNEVLARAIHERYVSDYRDSHPGGDEDPSLVDWDRLSETLKESNRSQAYHLGTKLQAIGCDVAPLTDWDAASFRLTPHEEDTIARMEHERWAEERRSQGWSLGPRDPAKKTNPNLVPWEDLPEQSKEMNRASVRQIPAFLACAGFQIYRMGEV